MRTVANIETTGREQGSTPRPPELTRTLRYAFGKNSEFFSICSFSGLLVLLITLPCPLFSLAPGLLGIPRVRRQLGAHLGTTQQRRPVRRECQSITALLQGTKMKNPPISGVFAMLKDRCGIASSGKRHASGSPRAAPIGQNTEQLVISKLSSAFSSPTHTHIEMRTDVNAVPHASRGLKNLSKPRQKSGRS